MQFKRNPYYQYFCGFANYEACFPCDATELVHFRKRIGVAGFALIFKASVELHGQRAEEPIVLIDPPCKKKTSPIQRMENWQSR